MMTNKRIWLVILILTSQLVKAKDIEIDTTFSSDTEIFPFEKNISISALSISAKIDLENDNSLIRVILTDIDNNEYLVYEVYPLIVDSNEFKIFDEAIETEILGNIIPNSLKIQIYHASIQIYKLIISSESLKMSSSEIDIQRESKIKEKNTEKLKYLMKNLDYKDIKWFPGETEISNLTYSEKKIIFGSDKYRSFGLEYYKGGIFVFPDFYENTLQKDTIISLQIKANSESQETEKATSSFTIPIKTTAIQEFEGFVFDFDWRAMHGANDASSPYYDGDIDGGGWMTPVQNQWCGNCWAFSAVAEVEAIVNLYYNQHLDIDLSEHDITSCSGCSASSRCEDGGWPCCALSYIRNTGVVNEDCFPNPASKPQHACSERCTTPTERIQINSVTSFSGTETEENLKRMVVRSPIVCSICRTDFCHAMVLIGFHKVKAGDRIYYIDDTTRYWIDIEEGDPLIGHTLWIFKNSWGEGSGDNGYYYIVMKYISFLSSYNTCAANGPITSLNYDYYDIRSNDFDGDGYYNWGIGIKPTHCPPCPNESDCNDIDPNIGPVDGDGAFSVNLPYSFGFENGLDGWRQSSNDSIDWTRNSGSTPSSGTGPSSAYEGTYYMYVEASSPNYPNKKAILVSPTYNLLSGCNANLTFNYHMYGSTMGSLELQLSIDGGANWETGIWSVAGNQGDVWKTASVNISGYTSNLIKFRFVATTGSNYTSDIAIDNIGVTESLSETEYISDIQTWNDYRSICGNLIIEEYGNITITGNVIMNHSANIILESGSELIIDGGKLVNANITVNSGGRLTIKNDGTIVLKNDEILVNNGGLFDNDCGEIKINQ